MKAAEYIEYKFPKKKYFSFTAKELVKLLNSFKLQWGKDKQREIEDMLLRDALTAGVIDKKTIEKIYTVQYKKAIGCLLKRKNK